MQIFYHLRFFYNTEVHDHLLSDPQIRKMCGKIKLDLMDYRFDASIFFIGRVWLFRVVVSVFRVDVWFVFVWLFGCQRSQLSMSLDFSGFKLVFSPKCTQFQVNDKQVLRKDVIEDFSKSCRRNSLFDCSINIILIIVDCNIIL